MRVVNKPNPSYPHYHLKSRVSFTGNGIVELFKNLDKHFSNAAVLMDTLALEYARCKEFIADIQSGPAKVTLAYVYYKYYGRLRIRARVEFDFNWTPESGLGGRPYLFMLDLGSVDNLVDPRPPVVRFFFDIPEERFTPEIPYWNAPK